VRGRKGVKDSNGKTKAKRKVGCDLVIEKVEGQRFNVFKKSHLSTPQLENLKREDQPKSKGKTQK